MSRRATVAATAVAAIAIATAGCAESAPEPEALAASPTPAPTHSPTPGPVPTPTVDLDPAEEAAAAEVLEVYQRFLELEIELAADPPPPGGSQPPLNEFTSQFVISRVSIAMSALHEHGLTRTGTPESRVWVTDVDLEAGPPTVRLLECFDTTGWPLVDGDGEPVPPADAPEELYAAAPGMYLREIDAYEYGEIDDGFWLLSEYELPHLVRPAGEDDPC